MFGRPWFATAWFAARWFSAGSASAPPAMPPIRVPAALLVARGRRQDRPARRTAGPAPRRKAG